jgi:hypothetical protein
MRMNANVKVDASHPHFVHIPDSGTQGIRAYREPEEPHPLQLTFLDADAERAWIAQIADLLSSGQAEEADRRLTGELAGFEGRLATLCKQVPAEGVTVEGWDDLMPILAEWEGPAITAITIGMTNPPDLVFDAASAPEPELLIGLYSDEAFPFSQSTNADLLSECSEEMPRWIGGEEDVEFYCTMAGLADLNGGLINCKHRHYLRDGRDGVEGRAPGGYVEYVVASWFLATRFLQAMQRAIAQHGAPARCRVVVGTVELNADFVTILGKERRGTSGNQTTSETQFATLTVKPWVRSEEQPEEAPPPPPATLRQRILAAEPVVEELPKGLFHRLFGRFRRR